VDASVVVVVVWTVAESRVAQLLKRQAAAKRINTRMGLSFMPACLAAAVPVCFHQKITPRGKFF